MSKQLSEETFSEVLSSVSEGSALTRKQLRVIRAALRKQIAKRVVDGPIPGEVDKRCPSCYSWSSVTTSYYGYCIHCGQKLKR